MTLRWWAVGVVLLGALLRLAMLERRPMHTDEAVHAVKFGTLLESGVYRYDPDEYHGPTLNYFTLPVAWIAGQNSLVELSESTLRAVPVVCGIGIVLLIVSLRSAGPVAVAAAGAMAACSPIMVYYSRYYIQETLLVFFTLALIVSARRFLRTGGTGWAVAAGVSAGLMAATKETWVIPAGMMGLAMIAVVAVRRRAGEPPFTLRIPGVYAGAAAGAVAGAVVFILFYSSFFTHWDGVRDAVLAYETYVSRAGGDGQHAQPWYYFLRMLLWWHESPGPVWTEAAIVGFGIVGIAGSVVRAVRGAGPAEGPGESDGAKRGRQAGSGAAFMRGSGGSPDPGLRLFMSIYACLMLLAMSILPYKTPWLVLGALLPLILTAGWGVADLLGRLTPGMKLPAYVLLAIAGGHLIWQSYRANFAAFDDPTTPMVYAHPNDDVRRIGEILEDIGRAGVGAVPVQVVVSGDDYWPLPWYLRRLPQVGWWGGIGPEFTPTPVILVSADREADLLARLYDAPPPGERPLYVPLFERPMYLRPGCEVKGYITLELSSRITRPRG